MPYAETFTWQPADDVPALLRIHAGGSFCQATILPTERSYLWVSQLVGTLPHPVREKTLQASVFRVAPSSASGV